MDVSRVYRATGALTVTRAEAAVSGKETYRQELTFGSTRLPKSACSSIGLDSTLNSIVEASYLASERRIS